MGELLAIRPLLARLAGDPATEVFLTTTTSTGLRVLENSLSRMVAWYGVFPLDFWPCSKTAWNRIDPDMAILMEGELWPEHIHQASLRRVPVMLVNARLSDRSYRRHCVFRKIAGCYFGRLTVLLASSETDRDRLVHLGWLPPERIQLTGNLKLDVAIPDAPSSDAVVTAMQEFGMPGNSILLLGSSTWPDEESALVDCYKALRTAHPRLRLMIVPRHAERKPALLSMIREKDVSFHFRSDSRQAADSTEVYIADTTGELAELTKFAAIVFIGKSIPPNRGGQTPVEAAAMGKPLIFGQEMSNFRDISRNLQDAGAVTVIQSADDLNRAVKSMLDSPGQRESMGNAARSVIEASRGATDRVFQKIQSLLE